MQELFFFGKIKGVEVSSFQRVSLENLDIGLGGMFWYQNKSYTQQHLHIVHTSVVVYNEDPPIILI